MDQDKTALDVIADCSNCGVCCLHMGFPAFMLPREPATAEQIENDPQMQQLLETGWTREELLKGHAGEKYWHMLPSELRQEWKRYVENYQRDGQLDGPCYWFDMETRMCKQHQYRPNVCRDFETGSDECREWRDEYQHLIRLNEG